LWGWLIWECRVRWVDDEQGMGEGEAGDWCVSVVRGELRWS